MLFRIGHGYDVHALAEGLPLVLGGVGIEHDKGCVAHSDGDVVIHALCDALLGAAALGDIGLHFPDTSDDYKGIDSKLLLHRVAKPCTEPNLFRLFRGEKMEKETPYAIVATTRNGIGIIPYDSSAAAAPKCQNAGSTFRCCQTDTRKPPKREYLSNHATN